MAILPWSFARNCCGVLVQCDIAAAAVRVPCNLFPSWRIVSSLFRFIFSVSVFYYTRYVPHVCCKDCSGLGNRSVFHPYTIAQQAAPSYLTSSRGYAFEPHFERFFLWKKRLRMRSLKTYLPGSLCIEKKRAGQRTAVYGTDTRNTPPSRGGEDYPGLGSRSIFYPYDSSVGNTFTSTGLP